MLEAKNSILLLGGNEYVEAIAMQMLMPNIADFWFFKYHRESDFNPNRGERNIL